MSVAGSPTDRFAADYADLDLPIMHQRTYDVRGFHLDGTRLLIRGVIDDQAPAGAAIPGDEESLTLHHMVVDVVVDALTTIIESVEARFVTNPHDTCPGIAPIYRQLAGVSMSRGYSNKVRELFGGPRGCTHVVALLQAMAPVVAQARWPMFARLRQDRETATSTQPMTPEQRRNLSRANLNTCHIWAEDGEMMALVDNGLAVPIPDPIRHRLDDLGIEDTWTSSLQPGARPATPPAPPPG